MPRKRPTHQPTTAWSQFETIWLRTKRYNADGRIRSGSGGVCYLYWPLDVSPAQKRALASLGIR